MNHIRAKYEKSEYVDEAHLKFNVDGRPLDVILHELFPNKKLIGLVPTLLYWLEDTRERKLVWDKIESNLKQVVPILMCPDDCDSSCTVVAAEIEKTDISVKWQRLGIDSSVSESMPDSIGTNVDWFDKRISFEFNKLEYEKFVSDFKKEIEKDEIKKLVQLWIDRIENPEQIPNSIKAFNFGLFESE